MSRRGAEFVHGCLDLLGPLAVSEQTCRELLVQAEEDGNLRWGTEQEAHASAQRISVMLALKGG